ncbi:hypothetical protein EDD18DRAFT_1202169 [Armillaria luteobubalina]|uniref:SAP domain-containing protein n=1 Tax=Armillaria luteobubalina TaxID=153913 RepID=A0AA39PDK4_9AGAR|nr:hypothetical protein EDD18DRAFT_1202169 [Armillaria luteobubalina]
MLKRRSAGEERACVRALVPGSLVGIFFFGLSSLDTDGFFFFYKNFIYLSFLNKQRPSHVVVRPNQTLTLFLFPSRYLIFTDPSVDLYSRIIVLGAIALVGLGLITLSVVWLRDWRKQRAARLKLASRSSLSTSTNHNDRDDPPCASRRRRTCHNFFLHLRGRSEDFPLPMQPIPTSPRTPSPPAAIQPYDPPTCPPPAYQQHGAPSSAPSSVWSCGALANVSVAGPPLPHAPDAGAEHDLTSGPKTHELPMRELDLDDEGNLQVQRVDLAAQSLKELRALCIGCQIPYSGTKPLLRGRLVQLSDQGMAKWKAAYIPPARIAHKGVRGGGIKKPNRLQARLLDAQQKFGGQEGGQNYTLKGSTGDKRSQAEVDGLLLWADRMVAKTNAAGPASRPLSHTHLPNNRQPSSLPIQTKDQGAAGRVLVSAMTEALKTHLPGSFSEANLTNTIQKCFSQEAPSNDFDFDHLVSESVTMDSSTEASPSSSPLALVPMPSPEFQDSVSDSVTTPDAAISAEAGPSGSPLMSSQTFEVSSTHPSSSSTGLTGGGIVGVQKRVLHLAHGVTLSYTEAMLPEYPPVRFGNDMNRLITSWDDSSPYYQTPEAFYPIILNGVPIPIKYWQEMYVRSHRGWLKLKSPWAKWKYIMEEYERLLPFDFWNRFTSKKTHKRLSMHAIDELLRAERKVKNTKLVQEARATLGENLNEDFQYRRGNTVKTMSREWNIARLYREKRNDEDKENQ